MTSVRAVAAEAGDHPVVVTGARLGFAASGLLHLLIAWLALQLAWGTGDEQADQSGALQVYAALAWAAFGVATGSGGGGGDAAGTAALMQSAGGRILVGIVGLVVVGVGIYHVVKGWSARFLRDLRENPGRWVVRAGRVGYIAKGGALVVVGGLLVAAAVTSDAAKAQGLDAALHTLLQVPAGTVLLSLIALGLAAYGLYSFARARHGRV